MLMTNVLPRRRTICAPGIFFSARSEFRTFMLCSLLVGVCWLGSLGLGLLGVDPALAGRGPSLGPGCSGRRHVQAERIVQAVAAGSQFLVGELAGEQEALKFAGIKVLAGRGDDRGSGSAVAG